MSINIYYTSSTLQTSIFSLFIDNQYLNNVITKMSTPDIFRSYDYENFRSYEDEIKEEYLIADDLNKTIFSLIPPAKIDEYLYNNTYNILYDIVDFIGAIQSANSIFTTNGISSCTNYIIKWSAITNVENGGPKPYALFHASEHPKTFYEQCNFFQEAFIQYTSKQMEADYESYRTNSYNQLVEYFNPTNFMGYILQRSIYIHAQILDFCQQFVSGRVGYLPPQYRLRWSVPKTAKMFVEKFSPTFFYGNQFVFPPS